MAAKKKLAEKKVHIKLEKVSLMQHGHEVCAKCDAASDDRAAHSFFKGLLVAFLVICLIHIFCRAVEV